MSGQRSPGNDTPTPLPGADIRTATDPGPSPLARALQGLLLGAAVGVVVALVTPRPVLPPGTPQPVPRRTPDRVRLGTSEH